MKLVPDVECVVDWKRAEVPWMTELLKRRVMGMGEEKDPKALRVLLARLNGFALSKRERPQVEDLLRKAYEAGVQSTVEVAES